MTHQALRRVYTWRVPPNWSPRDWREEMEAEAAAAAWEAERDFDPTRGIPVSAFVHARVLTRTLTRCRREWAYARRCGLHAQADHCQDVSLDGPSSFEVQESVRRCLDRLTELERRVIDCLFWERRTQV
jgi:DNA-directed RNA polymerase specialized sigma24 family protein